VVRFDRQGRVVAQHVLAEACALDATVGGWLASGRQQALRADDAAAPLPFPIGSLRIDNHWTVIPG
jgi:hypothetical protein